MIRYIILLISITHLLSCTSKPQDKFDDPIVIVNNYKLNGFEFSKRLVRKFVEQDIKYPKDEIINILKEQIVDDFVIQSLYDNYAHNNNILVKKELLDESFNKFKDGYPDSDSFEVFLSESGQNKSTLKDSLKDDLTRNLVNEALFNEENFDVDTKAVTEYYNNHKNNFKQEDQIKLKQIVFESEEDGIKILELLSKSRGKDFEILASKYSLGPEKVSGGDLGWVNVDSFPAFQEAAKTSSGQTTKIIKSENGFHIFKVVDKRKAKQLRLNDVKDDIKKRLIAEKKAEFIKNWIKNQMETAKIKINNDLLNKIVVNRPAHI